MKEFSKVFTSIANKYNYMSVFNDFLTMSVCALSMQRYENEYLKTINKYSKSEQKQFPILFAEMIKYYSDNSEGAKWVDGLGEFYEENSSKMGRSASGQFFTPVYVSTLMAMCADTSKQDKNISDPACGSGRCLIAHNRLRAENKYNFYVACDIDKTCVKMCVINFVLYGMRGVVIHMNSLTNEVYGGYRIYSPDTGLGVVKLSQNECLQYVVKSKKTEQKKTLTIENKTNVSESILNILNS